MRVDHASYASYSEPRQPNVPSDIDVQQIKSFVNLLHDYAKGIDGELVVTAIVQRPEDARGATSNTRFRVGDAQAMAEHVVARAREQWTNVYVGGYVLKPGVVGGNRRGTRDEMEAALLLLVDRDADKGRSGVLPCAATITLQTSAIPTPNHHSLLVFDPAQRPSVEEADRLGRALRSATGADSDTGDICRVFRVPGTLNWPSRKKLQRGRPLEPQLVRLLAATGPLVGADALRHALGTHYADAVGQGSHADHGDLASLLQRASPALREALRCHDMNGDRSPAAWAAIRLAVDEEFSDQEIAQLVLGNPSGVGERYSDSPKKLWKEIERARTKPKRSPGAGARKGKARSGRGTTEDSTHSQSTGDSSTGSSAPGPEMSDDEYQAGFPTGFSRAANGAILLLARNGDLTEWEPMCSPIWLLAKIRDQASENWGRLFEIETPDKVRRQVIISASELLVSSGERDPLRTLVSAGLELHATNKKRARDSCAHTTRPRMLTPCRRRAGLRVPSPCQIKLSVTSRRGVSSGRGTPSTQRPIPQRATSRIGTLPNSMDRSLVHWIISRSFTQPDAWRLRLGCCPVIRASCSTPSDRASVIG
jgi:hypothetical protein